VSGRAAALSAAEGSFVDSSSASTNAWGPLPGLISARLLLVTGGDQSMPVMFPPLRYLFTGAAPSAPVAA